VFKSLCCGQPLPTPGTQTVRQHLGSSGEEYEAHTPVMLVHGLCSATLRCQKSESKPSVCGLLENTGEYLTQPSRNAQRLFLPLTRCPIAIDKVFSHMHNRLQWEGTNVWLGFDKLIKNLHVMDQGGVKCMSHVSLVAGGIAAVGNRRYSRMYG
jgi:hypothetical protein